MTVSRLSTLKSPTSGHTSPPVPQLESNSSSMPRTDRVTCMARTKPAALRVRD